MIVRSGTSIMRKRISNEGLYRRRKNERRAKKDDGERKI